LEEAVCALRAAGGSTYDGLLHPLQYLGHLLQLANGFSRPSADLYAKSYKFNWIKDQEDGLFVQNTKDGLVAQNIFTGKKDKIMNKEDVFPNAEGYSLNADKSKVLWASNKTEVYRYSFKANYFIQDSSTKERKPLHPDQKGDIQLVTWSPTWVFRA
jgi:Dipeptidyl peptidase IV (DPP IV) N-terminal region